MGDVARGRNVKSPIYILCVSLKSAWTQSPTFQHVNHKEAFSNALCDACSRRNKHGHAASQVMHVEANADADEKQVLVQ